MNTFQKGALKRQKQDEPLRFTDHCCLVIPPNFSPVLHFASVLLTTCSMRRYLHSFQVAQVFQLLHDSTSIRAITGFDVSPAQFQDNEGDTSKQMQGLM